MSAEQHSDPEPAPEPIEKDPPAEEPEKDEEKADLVPEEDKPEEPTEKTTKKVKRTAKTYGKRRTPTSFPALPNVTFGECVGSGYFSHVYQGTYRDKPAAIKLVERGGVKESKREIEVLKALKGIKNTVHLYAAHQTENMYLIFEYINSISQRRFFHYMKKTKLRRFIREVLIALEGSKSVNVVHRDLKLANVLVTPKYKRVVLIDWGCACFCSESMSPIAGSRTCRSPEMLLRFRNYGFGCDMWALGTMIIDLLSEGKCPWRLNSDEEVIIKLSHYFGSKPFYDLAEYVNYELSDNVKENMVETPDEKFEDCFTERMKPFYTDKLKRFLDHLLTIDPRERYTVEQAMKADYFYTTKAKAEAKAAKKAMRRRSSVIVDNDKEEDSESSN